MLRKFMGCRVSMKAGFNCVIAMIVVMLTSPVMASGGGAKLPEGVNYIALEPALVVNYGGPGKSRFMRVELSLRAENATDATEITHHLPLIRDRLVSILSKQTEAVISTAEGKEYLRLYALAEINTALLKVTGHRVDEPHAKQGVGKKEGKTKRDEAANAETDDGVRLPSAADVIPVKGPATDLFFNNFIVQK